ncbi:MAG TPA: copper chaperone PCu(A)C [Reyranella sp.]|jgi:copper(I)-binding protein|nr:copper chaperone PCu(A)C [Reyranella sp.]
MAPQIEKPWARASDRTSWRFCGFVTLVNRSSTPDRLIAASSPIARAVAVCGIKVVGSDIAMRALKGGLGVPADTTITLKPRGYHLYFLGAKPRPKPGDKVPVTLTFEKAGEQKIMLDVHAPGPVGKETLHEGVES